MRVKELSTQAYNISKIPNVKTQKSKSGDFVGSVSTASKKVKGVEDGEILGITMVKEEGTNIFWGMKAMYSEKSTYDNPIIQVSTNYGGETVSYDVRVNEVDPSNASKLEMFALCSYADSKNQGDKSTFGTFATLGVYEENAKINGYWVEETMNIQEKFKNEKINWESACRKIQDVLLRCKDFTQYNKGISILELFSKYPKE